MPRPLLWITVMSDASIDRVNRGDWPDLLARLFSWILLAAIGVFLVNNVLSLVFDWPGISPVFFCKRSERVFMDSIVGLCCWVCRCSGLCTFKPSTLFEGGWIFDL